MITFSESMARDLSSQCLEQYGSDVPADSFEGLLDPYFGSASTMEEVRSVLDKKGDQLRKSIERWQESTLSKQQWSAFVQLAWRNYFGESM